MVFPKKLVASIAVFISLGFIYFRVSTAVAFENTSSASLLPEMRFRFGRLLLEWYLSRLLLYYLLRRKYKKSFESMRLRYAFKRFFYGRLR